MATKDLEVLSVRASRGAGEKLKAWAEAKGIAQGKILDEMLELYETRHEGTQPSTVETLLRPMFRIIERELGTAFEELEAKVQFLQTESGTHRDRAEHLDCSLVEQKEALKRETLEWHEKAKRAEAELLRERATRETAQTKEREALEMGKALTISLTEAHTRLEEVSRQVATHAELLRDRDSLSLQNQRLSMDKEMAEMNLVVLKEELAREKANAQRTIEGCQRENQALEREWEARFAKAELERERATLAKEEAQRRKVDPAVDRRGE